VTSDSERFLVALVPTLGPDMAETLKAVLREERRRAYNEGYWDGLSHAQEDSLGLDA
jgi:hypothetical protein